MRHHAFGRTPFIVTDVGFGARQIGGAWGDVSEADGRAALNAALDAGMTFIDTADVYGDGRSEKIIADVLKARGGERPMVATKAGRRLSPHVADGYTKANLEGFIDRSLRISASRALISCSFIAHRPKFSIGRKFCRARRIAEGGQDQRIRRQRREGRGSAEGDRISGRAQHPDHLQHFPPASRPSVLQGSQAQERRRHRPRAARLRSTVRQDHPDTQFAGDDHRNFNRHGEAFDVGETFAGVPFEVGLQAVEEVRKLVPADTSMAAFALRWILMNDAVTVVIPGARNADQAKANAAAADLAPLSADVMAATREIYERLIAPHVHHRW